VEIIGPVFGEGIWKPLAELNDIPYRFTEVKGRFKAYWQLKTLLAQDPHTQEAACFRVEYLTKKGN